jgi:probable rRNA maturation factor
VILVEADASDDWDSRSDWEGLASRAVNAAVASSRYRRVAGSLLGIEISVRFTDDAEVQALNAAWRGKDKATNVLSFPMVEPEQLDTLPPEGDILLGDIVLAHGVCAREAAEKGITVETHAAHLLVHGTLHLLGYDHEQAEGEAEEMEEVERAALAGLGIADPYAATEVHTHLNARR